MKSFGQFIAERKEDVDAIASVLANKSDIDGKSQFESAIDALNYIQQDPGILVDKIGNGSFSTAYKALEGKPEYIMKVQRGTFRDREFQGDTLHDKFGEFANIVMANKLWEKNPIFPKIIYAKQFPDGTHMWFLEHLKVIDSGKEIFESIVSSVINGRDAPDELEHKNWIWELDNGGCDIDQLLQFRKICKHSIPGVFFDAHLGNFGWRPNGQFVYFDPVASKSSLAGVN